MMQDHRSTSAHASKISRFKEGEAPPSHFSLRIQGVIQTIKDDKLEEPNSSLSLWGKLVEPLLYKFLYCF